jgi:CRP/FNR family nitrogen fixation transcriptional regulator
MSAIVNCGAAEATNIASLPNIMEHHAACAKYHKGESICFQDSPAAYGYRILSGAARESALLTDGRRHIVGFLLAGDISGLWARGTHSYSVEAIVEPTIVARYSRRYIESLIESNPEVALLLHQLALDAVERLQSRMTLLAKASALEKVSGFLFQMSDREDMFELPMSRYDIADYLAIAVETVSRSLTGLQQRRIVALGGARHVRIIDRQALQRCCEHNGPRFCRQSH